MKKHFLILLLMPLACLAQEYAQADAAIQAIVERIQLPVIPNYVVNVKQMGAKGDSLRDARPAFDKALARCKKKGGGTIVVPEGVYLLNGPIHLVSHLRLLLEDGARLKFSDAPQHYLPTVLTSWEGTMLYNYSPLIYANGCTDIAICGNGTIDGQGSRIWNSFKARESVGKQRSRDMNHSQTPVKARQFGEGYFLRPPLLQLLACKNILIEDVTIEDAPFWCVHLLQSESITIRGLKYNAFNYNNDGIDPEYCRDVLIEDISFNNADDNIAIKAGRDHDGRANAAMPSRDIVIRNCRFKGLHGVVLGSEMSAGIENVYVQHCNASGYLKRGIYYKTNADRGGFIRNIFVRDLVLDEVEDGLYITANYMGEGEGFASAVSNLHFSDVRCRKANGTAIVVQGFAQKKVTGVSLNRINFGSAQNGLTIRNAEVTMEEVFIGEEALIPTAVSHTVESKN